MGAAGDGLADSYVVTHSELTREFCYLILDLLDRSAIMFAC
jgi:hypothetical protein